MSGTGKKQRTKGNVKPSSSARAAELLSAAGYGIPNTVSFMGFDAIPVNADFEGSSSTSGNVDEPEDLDEDFRVAFRKAMKKDFVTKTKALREVASLISEKETKAVLLAWQCWPRLYSKLSLDGNFKVRELAHTVLGAFAQKLNRQIAGQLKSVVPYWLMGEHDPYQAAAQAAKQTFQDAFPSGKRPQVLAFCKEAIVSQCSSLVFSVDEASAGGSCSSTDTAEESFETRSIRLSTCSLWALCTLLSTITEEELISTQESLSQAVLSLPKFSKLGDKAKPIPVRVAWFSLILCLIRRHQALLSDKANKLVPVIANGLEETDGAVVGYIWDCFANYVNVNAEEFWQNCNFRKAFLPKLVSITRKAFNGCAKSIGDSVSVAIRVLPIGDDAVDIYSKLLMAFHSGCICILDSKMPSSEMSAFARVYCDFVRTMCSNSAEVGFAKDFLSDPEKSLFVISSCLKSSSPLLVREVFQHLANMVAIILDDLQSADLSNAAAAFQSNLFQAIMLELRAKTSTGSLCHLLVALENRSAMFKASCASICRSCLTLYEETGDGDYLKIFRDVLCDSTDVSHFVVAFEGLDDPTAAAIKFSGLLLSRVYLLDGDQAAGVEQLGYVLDCCFALFLVLDSSQITDMLKQLCQLRRFETQYQLLSKLRRTKNEPFLVHVPKPEFFALFLECFKSVCSLVSAGSTLDERRKQWRLFSEYLAGTTTQGALIPTHVAAAALEHLTTLVRAGCTGQNLSFIVALVAQLASDALLSHQNLLAEKAGLTLVVQLFDLYCTHSDELNDEALSLTKKAWTSAASAYISSNDQWITTSKERRKECLVFALSQRLLDHVRRAGLNREKLEWLCSVALDVVSAFNEALSRAAHEDNAQALSLIVSHLLSVEEAEVLTSSDRSDNGWMINAALSGRVPMPGFELCDAGSSASSGLSSDDRDDFLNLAAYGLRFGYCLNSDESPFGGSPSSLTDQQAVIAIRGFSTIIYICNTSTLLSICGDHRHSASLKAFGSWMALIAVDFWNSLETDKRRDVAQTAARKILASNNALAAQAMEFLQYDLEKPDFLIDGLTYENRQLITMLCAAPLLLEIRSNYVDPAVLSPNVVSGYLHMAANNALKRLSAFDWLMTVKEEFLDEKMLYSCDVAGSTDDVIILNISLMRYLDQVVYCLLEMNNEQRDFLLCSILTWLQSCSESDLSNGRVQLFAFYAMRLFSNIAKFMESIQDDMKTGAAAEEWTGFFLKGCIQIIVPTFFKLAKETSASPIQRYLLREISSAVSFARQGDLVDVELPALLAPELDSLGYPEKLQTLLLNTFPLLESPVIAVQVAAFSVVEKFVGQLYEYESKRTKETDGDEIRELPPYFLNTLVRTYELIENEFDDLHHLENSPAFSSYFLTWKLLLKFFATVKTDDRPAYSAALSSSKILDRLMLTLLTVLPENVSSSTKNPFEASGSGFSRKLLEYEKVFENVELKSVVDVADAIQLFLEAPAFTKGMSTTLYVQRFSCHVFFETLRSFPAAIRHWFNRQEKKVANLMDQFATKYVSPLLCSLELQAITKGEKKYDNMTLLARPAAREVVACYKLEELTMELVVTLPQNYPLNAAAVDVNHRVGVSVEQWRKWMLQLTVFLSHQNGGLLDGMLLWKRCIDKHLQGVEDCMICMMAVHGSNYQLPKITCKQCKKKFHAACLYKWFNTSSNTSCPLCRTTF